MLGENCFVSLCIILSMCAALYPIQHNTLQRYATRQCQEHLVTA